MLPEAKHRSRTVVYWDQYLEKIPAVLLVAVRGECNAWNDDICVQIVAFPLASLIVVGPNPKDS